MIDIGFKWSHAREYECVEVEGAKVIRQKGTRREKPKEPLMIDGNGKKPLYARFAELDSSEKSCVDFANAWGLLTTESPSQAEPLDFWRKEIRKIKGLMNVLEAKEKPPGGLLRRSRDQVSLPSITVRLVPGELDVDGNIGRPKLLLGPKDLLEAMYLQLGKFVAGDGSLRSCRQCGEWFECGGTESRRSIAIFCSEKCKNRFHYLERTKR
jgi:hypothetical protein